MCTCDWLGPDDVTQHAPRLWYWSGSQHRGGPSSVGSKRSSSSWDVSRSVGQLPSSMDSIKTSESQQHPSTTLPPVVSHFIEHHPKLVSEDIGAFSDLSTTSRWRQMLCQLLSKPDQFSTQSRKRWLRRAVFLTARGFGKWPISGTGCSSETRWDCASHYGLEFPEQVCHACTFSIADIARDLPEGAQFSLSLHVGSLKGLSPHFPASRELAADPHNDTARSMPAQ